METISQLLLLFQDFFLISQLISEGDILQSILMHLLILQRLTLLPLIPLFWGNNLSGPGEDSIRRNRPLQLFELLFDLMALSLFLIEFSL